MCNAVAGNANLFVAGGGPTTSNYSTLIWSDDSGASWNNSYNGTSTYPFAGGICYAVVWNGSKWIAGGLGANPLAWSYDGKTWQQSKNGGTIFTEKCVGLTWNGGSWYAIGSGTNQLASSIDGITWTSISYTLNTPKAIASRRVISGGGGGGGGVSLSQTFGFSQQWYEVTAERAIGVTYYNQTGKPIMVVVNSFNAASQNMHIRVDGMNVTHTYFTSSIYFSQMVLIIL